MLIMSLILFIMMGIDKAGAKAGGRRIRERTLFILAALGGALGGVLGMSGSIIKRCTPLSGSACPRL